MNRMLLSCCAVVREQRIRSNILNSEASSPNALEKAKRPRASQLSKPAAFSCVSGSVIGLESSTFGARLRHDSSGGAAPASTPASTMLTCSPRSDRIGSAATGWPPATVAALIERVTRTDIAPEADQGQINGCGSQITARLWSLGSRSSTCEYE